MSTRHTDVSRVRSAAARLALACGDPASVGGDVSPLLSRHLHALSFLPELLSAAGVAPPWNGKPASAALWARYYAPLLESLTSAASQSGPPHGIDRHPRAVARPRAVRQGHR